MIVRILRHPVHLLFQVWGMVAPPTPSAGGSPPPPPATPPPSVGARPASAPPRTASSASATMRTTERWWNTAQVRNGYGGSFKFLQILTLLLESLYFIPVEYRAITPQDCTAVLRKNVLVLFVSHTVCLVRLGPPSIVQAEFESLLFRNNTKNYTLHFVLLRMSGLCKVKMSPLPVLKLTDHVRNVIL